MNPSERAAAVHREAIVIDGHCDVLIPVSDGKMKLDQRVELPAPSNWSPPLGLDIGSFAQFGMSAPTVWFGCMGQYDLQRWREGGVTTSACSRKSGGDRIPASGMEHRPGERNVTRSCPAVPARPHLICFVAALLAAVLPAAAENEVTLLGEDPGLAHLAAEIERISETSLGRVGVAAIHLESGRGVLLNGDEPFPMASTYKVPIAVEILALVDEGKRSLDDLVTIEDGHHFLTHGAMSDFFAAPGSRITLENLLEMMLRNSDNMATDLLFHEAGGGRAITARIKAAGIDDLTVDRTTRALIANWLGRPDATVENPIPAAEYAALIMESAASPPNPAQRAAKDRAFLDDPRDHSTPRAMATLLSGVWKREILSAEGSATLIDIMARCDTGQRRLPGILPPGTPVAHKTGTIGQATNDVGVITLPGNAGRVVAAVYVKDSRLPSTEAMEPVIAQIARAAHDYFLFHPAGS